MALESEGHFDVLGPFSRLGGGVGHKKKGRPVNFQAAPSVSHYFNLSPVPGRPRSVKKLERPEAQRPSGVSIAVPEMVRYNFQTAHDAVAGVRTEQGGVYGLGAHPGLRDGDGGP